MLDLIKNIRLSHFEHRVATVTDIRSNDTEIQSNDILASLSAYGLDKAVHLSTDELERFNSQLESGGPNRAVVIGWIAEVVWPLALKNEGSRLVQKALEVADVTEQCLLVKGLRSHVLTAATSAHANH